VIREGYMNAKTILNVEDNEMIRRLLLEGEGAAG
jgi:hypothetical protein